MKSNHYSLLIDDLVDKAGFRIAPELLVKILTQRNWKVRYAGTESTFPFGDRSFGYLNCKKGMLTLFP
ncbi:MAG UNVERIFIED_CONTAM: hypothetical protein LVR29_20290 [Microcystis novacekii LVE1205-3]